MLRILATVRSAFLAGSAMQRKHFGVHGKRYWTNGGSGRSSISAMAGCQRPDDLGTGLATGKECPYFVRASAQIWRCRAADDDQVDFQRTEPLFVSDTDRLNDVCGNALVERIERYK